MIINKLVYGFYNVFIVQLEYVVIVLENCVEYFVFFYVLKRVNMVEVLINCVMCGVFFVWMIDQMVVLVLFIFKVYFEVIYEVWDSLVYFCILVFFEGIDEVEDLFLDLVVLLLDSFYLDCSDYIVFFVCDIDMVIILFILGIIGVFKGCLLFYCYVVRIVENMIVLFCVIGEDCVYFFYFLFYIGVVYYDILFMMMIGGWVILCDWFSVLNFWFEVYKFGVIWFMMLGFVQQLLWVYLFCLEENMYKVMCCWGILVLVFKVDFDVCFNFYMILGGGYGLIDVGWVVVF